MKPRASGTPLQFEHVDGSLRLTLTETTNKGFDVHESTFSLIVPHNEVPDVIEKMLTTPDMDIEALRGSEDIQKLVLSDMEAHKMVETAYNMIVAANMKTRMKRALKEQGRLIKIAKAFNGMSDSEWEALDPVAKDSLIANALRAEQVMAE